MLPGLVDSAKNGILIIIVSKQCAIRFGLPVSSCRDRVGEHHR